MKLTEQDLQQLQQRQQTPENVAQQIEHFTTGFPFICLAQPATIENHGIQHFSTKEIDDLAAFFEHEAPLLKVTLFVPASGAASRMFKSLFAYINDEKEGQGIDVQEFIERLPDFSFFEELKTVMQKAKKNIEKESYKTQVEFLLQEKGLNYGNLPKGLLRFHNYPNGARLAMEEHLIEGTCYGKDAQGIVRLHFTVSPEHQEDFINALKNVLKKYEQQLGVVFEIGFSKQKLSTDIIAVDLDNKPFRNADGSLLFRPGGHGALIENLNDLHADIIFIKNIDNVVPDRLKSETFRYKKAIGGLLIQIKNEIVRLLHSLDNNEKGILEKALYFIENKLFINLPEGFHKMPEYEQTAFLHQFLNRPIRVCGMVKNVGEPGGGPFFVQNESGNLSLQIVESSQVDKSDKKQMKIFKSATHFNPVDLACYVKNYQGDYFNLLQFVDTKTGFISEKSKDGKSLKAQELPGLWNGAMAHWITLFVETPLITFNPVKTVNDLLRPEHQ